MKDELKIFTEKNREKFEHYSLDLDKTWGEIEQRLNEMETTPFQIPWKIIMKVAAAIVVLITIGFGYYLNNQRIAFDKNGIALHNISSELADTEAFYMAQIDEKLKLIEVTSGSVDPEVMQQLKVLDQDYESLKSDLKDNADSEEVINAMIEYYRLKLAMLEKILVEIQKSNDNEEDEEALSI